MGEMGNLDGWIKPIDLDQKSERPTYRRKGYLDTWILVDLGGQWVPRWVMDGVLCGQGPLEPVGRGLYGFVRHPLTCESSDPRG